MGQTHGDDAMTRHALGSISRAIVAVALALTAAMALLIESAGAQDQSELMDGSTLEFTVGPREQPTVGALVTWDYEVANKSNFRFGDLVVEDAREGRVCLIALLEPGQTRTCSLPTMAGVVGYETTAAVTGTPITSDDSTWPPVTAEVKRSYFVLEDPAPPDDLAFSAPPPLPNGTVPAWPVDRWAPYAVAMAVIIATGVTVIRKGPMTQRGVPATARKSASRR